MYSRDQIREGMIARSADGEKLGKVTQLGEAEFVIEKGFFFPKDYVAQYSAITDIRDDEIHLMGRKEEFLMREEEVDFRQGGETEPALTLSEEELEIRKRSRQAGEVKLHKTIETEQRTVTVPVQKERVTIERTPVAKGEASEISMEAEEISVPLHEEEVIVSKRPVAREEVRLKKEQVIEDREVTEPLRKERAEIRAEGEVEGPVLPRGMPDIDPNKRS
jgi:uncharacterized protein (TIGR02271 family)